MEGLNRWFWQDHFWLPHGITFKDLQDKPGIVYAKPQDLYILPVTSIAIYLVRLLYERYIALPFARSRGLADGWNRKAPKRNEKLEGYFKKKPSPSKESIVGLAKQLDWTTAAVERWFRRKRNWNRPSMQTKFCETSWRFLFYSAVFFYGMFTIWQSPWFWDNAECWNNYPLQNLDQSTYIYYILEVSFYMSLLISVMGDIKRKDFMVQLIHHMATVFLIIFSYITNYVRIGTLVMAVHDISDVFLEGAKCIFYLNHYKLAETMFVFFAVIFFVTRLFIFPFWIIHTSAIKSLPMFSGTVPYYFFNVLLLTLQCLHIFWGLIILKMAYKMIVQGEVTGDDRSDIEEESSEEDEK